MKNRWSAALAVALVLVAAAGMAWFALRFGAAYLKQEIVAAVEARTGRVLNIEGQLAVEFSWPEALVGIGRVSLSERGGTQTFASIDSVRFVIALPPLLDRQLVLRSVEVDGFAATVIRRPDGGLNIADLAGVQSGAGTPATIDSIRVTQARIDWRDEQTGKRATLTLAGLAGNTRMLHAEQLAFDADAQLDEARLVVRLLSPLELDLTQRSIVLPRLTGRVELSHPALRRRMLALPLAGELRADLIRQTASARLASAFDDTQLDAAIEVLAFAPPALRLNLDIDRIDLDRYLMAAASGSKAQDGGIFSALDRIDLAGRVKIGQFASGGFKASNVQFQLDPQLSGGPAHAPRH